MAAMPARGVLERARRSVARDGEREHRVPQVVHAAKRQRGPSTPPSSSQPVPVGVDRPRARRARRRRRAPRRRCDRRASAPPRTDLRLRGRHDRERRRRRTHVALLAQHAREIAEPLEMLLADRRDDGDVGLDDARAAPRPRPAGSCPISTTATSASSGMREQRERHADVVVEVAARRVHARARVPSAAREQLLRARLAVRAGDGDRPCVPTRAAGSAPSRPSATRRVVRRRTPARRASRAALASLHDDGRGALRRRRRRGTSCASNRSPASATNRSPAATVRVSVLTRDERASAARRGAAATRARRRRGRASRTRGCSSALALRRVAASRAISVSVIGGHELANDLALVERIASWCRESDRSRGPCPRAPRHRPGAAMVERARDRVAPVLDALVRSRRCIPASMSSRIRSGSSVRGLSLVTIATSAPRSAMRAHLGPLAAVAVAAAAEDDDQPPRRERTHGGERALERVGRVRVVAQHRRALVHDARAGPGTCGSVDEPRGDRVAGHAERPRRRRGAERVRDVEVADQRQRDVRAASPPASSVQSLPRGVVAHVGARARRPPRRSAERARGAATTAARPTRGRRR